VKPFWRRVDLVLRAICAVGLLGMGVLFYLGFQKMMPSDEIVANPTLPVRSWIVGSPPMQNVLRLETATTEEEQRRGLMARNEVGAYDGMAFPFGGRDAAFWMRGTRFDLDIAYVDPSGRVSRVVTGRAYDERLLPGGPSSVVIEVRAGRARLLGLVPGSKVVRAGTDTGPKPVHK
jgi:uncharacterized membrane protein (UPF0127 family)